MTEILVSYLAFSIRTYCKWIDNEFVNDYDNTINKEKDMGMDGHIQREGGWCKPDGGYSFLLPWSCP